MLLRVAGPWDGRPREHSEQRTWRAGGRVGGREGGGEEGEGLLRTQGNRRAGYLFGIEFAVVVADRARDVVGGVTLVWVVWW